MLQGSHKIKFIFRMRQAL